MSRYFVFFYCFSVRGWWISEHVTLEIPIKHLPGSVVSILLYHQFRGEAQPGGFIWVFKIMRLGKLTKGASECKERREPWTEDWSTPRWSGFKKRRNQQQRLRKKGQWVRRQTKRLWHTERVKWKECFEEEDVIHYVQCCWGIKEREVIDKLHKNRLRE